jgi:hypothetical protein
MWRSIERDNTRFFQRMKKFCNCGVPFVFWRSIERVIIIYCFLYKSQNLILFFLIAIILATATVNPLLIFNILIYFLVSDFSLLIRC